MGHVRAIEPTANESKAFDPILLARQQHSFMGIYSFFTGAGCSVNLPTLGQQRHPLHRVQLVME